jgi:hypothetical protein
VLPFTSRLASWTKHPAQERHNTSRGRLRSRSHTCALRSLPSRLKFLLAYEQACPGATLRHRLARAQSRFEAWIDRRPDHLAPRHLDTGPRNSPHPPLRQSRLRRPYAEPHTTATATIRYQLPPCRPDSGIAPLRHGRPHLTALRERASES